MGIDKTWEGGIILKNSLFPTKLLLTEGDTDITDNLLKDETEKPYLKITQRLRLDEAKLEDVSKRINSSCSRSNQFEQQDHRSEWSPVRLPSVQLQLGLVE